MSNVDETTEKIPENVKSEMTAVLRNYVSLGVIGRACDDAGVSRTKHLEWLNKYPVYKERFEETKERFVDGLESVAIERAKEKSDTLLIMMLKAHRGNVYKDKSEVDHQGLTNPIQIVFAEGMLTDDEKKMLRGDIPEEE